MKNFMDQNACFRGGADVEISGSTDKVGYLDVKVDGSES